MYKFAGKTALILALMVCAGSGASARFGGDQIGNGSFTGVESSPGVCDMMIATCFGNTFVLNGFGENESRYLTVSLNYYNSLPNGGNGFSVLGGTWSLVVIRDNQYAGTLYGVVENGSIVFPETNPGSNEKITTVNLKTIGGLGVFDGRRSKKILYYELRMTTDLMSKKTVGMLEAITRQTKIADLPRIDEQ